MEATPLIVVIAQFWSVVLGLYGAGLVVYSFCSFGWLARAWDLFVLGFNTRHSRRSTVR